MVCRDVGKHQYLARVLPCCPHPFPVVLRTPRVLLLTGAVPAQCAPVLPAAVFVRTLPLTYLWSGARIIYNQREDMCVAQGLLPIVTSSQGNAVTQEKSIT